jgi:translation initiation factor 4E
MRYLNRFLACIGEEFENSNVIGVVLSIRERRNLLEIWLRDRKESEKIRIGEKLRIVLEMDPENLTFFFKEHSKSLTVIQK